MIRTILLFTTLTLAAPLIHAAAEAESMEGDRVELLDQRVTEAKERLNLTDEQVESVKPMIIASGESMAAVLKKYGIDVTSDKPRAKEKLGLRGARKLGRELDTVRADTLDDLKKILNSEQLAEFKAMQQERKDKMRAQILSRR
jgi:hypothetical protein